MHQQKMIRETTTEMTDHGINTLTISCCGRDWALNRPADLETLWDSLTDDEFTEDERLPYWVELWPSSLSLAGWLLKNKDLIQNAACLDLGCGLGFTALVGSWLNARVVAVDYETKAFPFARINAQANSVPNPLWVAMDWRHPAVLSGSFDYIWAGDIMYERRFVVPVLKFLEHSLKPGGRVWLAEPGRNVYDLFKEELEKNNWLSECILRDSVAALHEQKAKVSVNLWELARKDQKN